MLRVDGIVLHGGIEPQAVALLAVVERTLERVTGRIVDELRRRLGGAFTTGELAELYYEQGTDWCLDIAVETAPDNPRAWDSQTVADAAFARYVRGAIDFAGGRRVAAD